MGLFSDRGLETCSHKLAVFGTHVARGESGGAIVKGEIGSGSASAWNGSRVRNPTSTKQRVGMYQTSWKAGSRTLDRCARWIRSCAHLRHSVSRNLLISRIRHIRPLACWQSWLRKRCVAAWPQQKKYWMVVHIACGDDDARSRVISSLGDAVRDGEQIYMSATWYILPARQRRFLSSLYWWLDGFRASSYTKDSSV